jgi:hypothetical protein
MKQIVYTIILLVLVVIGYVWCRPSDFEVEERFVVRRGGRIETILLEGDLGPPIWIDAASSAYFRFTSTDDPLINIYGIPVKDPLGYFRDNYFSSNDLDNRVGNWKVTEAKGRVEVEISQAEENLQKIQITYYKPLWQKMLFCSGLFFIFYAIFWIFGPPDDYLY